ncbi:BREX-1 system adenine-specific DNA-methyltransferase PglX [Rhodococcus qingshengii]|uniref:BREX-1 system adenine-specific DNA-methyltransferase PglX n=1 Tax=Rhodococcus qingshengii TaxID=334542 RepID=UPI0021131143|nr:BREX-1 system adenine-specific DNA-methyltransferase PglX [Rhodococcus qingshengii]UUE25330.1 BREX-1 system adenine-specific DNA-methyltransferase PglX [Rhodococcus qingshengii]
MDTKPLESFAKAARRELIVAVEARVSTVLAAGSVARSERSETVRLLESEIADHSREHVIDRVAYTWFNRLIALRFMDARGYTDAGIVSPASGQAHGQPEILADAKRGDVNGEVVTNIVVHEAIIGLLDGTRRSTDAEGEAYALLLTEYCRNWHKTMPFMFEAEGAYTELLVPAGLLADGALLSRARDVLTEDVCGDVEVIGWLYQFYISERKDEVFAGFKKNGKAGAEEIPAATQLFTPHWIVRYLLENSLGRLWMLNRPTSRLVDQMDYYIAPVDEETDFLKVSGPEELTVIDPACGSGHMLTYAFDLLYSIYDGEGYAPSEIPGLILTHNLHGTEIDPRAGALAAFALTMKARGKDRRFFTRSGISPKICVIEPISFTPDGLDLLVTKDGDRDAEGAFWNQFRDADTLGSLIQPNADGTAQAATVLEGLKDQEETLYYDTLDRARRVVAQAETLSATYLVAVANPPYMGSSNMSGILEAFVQQHLPDAKADLFAAFIERALTLSVKRGYIAMITKQNWLFRPAYTALRKRVLAENAFHQLLHLGPGAFDSLSGEIASTAAFVLENQGENAGPSWFARLVDGVNEVAKERDLRALISGSVHPYRRAVEEFLAIPGAPICYWMSDTALEALACGPYQGDAVVTREGMATGNNARYLRFWWEVANTRIGRDLGTRAAAKASGLRWFPYNKAGGARRWYGLDEYVVDWAGDGRELQTTLHPSGSRIWAHNFNLDFIFRENVSWSSVTSRGLALRYYPQGFLFADAGPSAFARGDRSALFDAMAFANSGFGSEFADLLNPTHHFKAGDFARLPAPHLPSGDIQELVEKAISIARTDWNTQETAPGFAADMRTAGSGRISEWVAELCGVGEAATDRLLEVEALIENLVSEAMDEPVGLIDVPDRASVTLRGNFAYEFAGAADAEAVGRAGLVADFMSYAVGCMFGRYSLDVPGLVLADQGATVQDYLSKVSAGASGDVTFMPDADNVIPFVDDGWFEDDVVERVREFLKVAFGVEYFEENLRFVEESLGVKTLRDYFITKSGKSKFFDDHVKRYKKRPIYWMFSSPKGSFNALIYLHRYTPSTVSTVLNEYLREYENKLQKAFERAETASAGGTSAKDQKEADRLRKVLAELRDYEHDVLYPLATQQVEIDLDDGVKVNYPKFYPAVKKIAGLEASDG